MARNPRTLILAHDRRCQMERLTLDDAVIYEGNYWDWHPGCHRVPYLYKGLEAQNEVYRIFARVKADWKGSRSLFLEVERILVEDGFEVESGEEEYTYS